MFEFVCLLGEVTDRNVYVTHENSPEHCIFALRRDENVIEAPQRAENRTDFGASLGADIRSILEPFAQPTHDVCAEVPVGDGIDRVVARWADVHQPNAYNWHTLLTADEFRLLRDLDLAIDMFFGPKTPEEWCEIGGFKMGALKRQFWDTVERGRRLFI